MKEQQCLDCGLFNLLHRATCEYCGSTNLKVMETSTTTGEKIADVLFKAKGVTLSKDDRAFAGSVIDGHAEASRKRERMKILSQDVSSEYAVLGPAFLQCGKITGEIKDGVTLCGKPMYHEGKC